jgi:phage shock protein C
VTDQPLEPEEKREAGSEPASEPELEPDAEPTQVTPPPPDPTAVEPGVIEPGVAEPGPKRLFRSRDDSVIAGVCGGLGKYLDVDPVLIRIAAVVLVFAGGAGILLYVIGWIAIPEEPDAGAAATTTASAEIERTSGAVLLGFVFVVLGLFFLLDELWPDFLSWRYTWPIALIAVGIAIVVRGRR